MRQLLLRVPDDLHARLSARAQRENISVNALANRVLQFAAPPPPPADQTSARRQELRERARGIGILVELQAPSVSPQRFTAALRDTEGAGPVLDQLWANGR